MPQLATNVVDQAAVKLFKEWIASLDEKKATASAGEPKASAP
jgi:hypothetical protein